jgi:hypothetical protein
MIAAAFAADDPNLGTWKLNEAKSKLAAGQPKNHTVVYEAMGENIKVTVDGTDKDGNAVHTEWTGMFDGKEYPVTGDSTADMRSYKRINEHTLEITNKKEGKVTNSGRIEVSSDGKSRKITLSGMDASGKKMKSVGVYDKQ